MGHSTSAAKDCKRKLELCMHDWEWQPAAVSFSQAANAASPAAGQQNQMNMDRNTFCRMKDIDMYTQYKVADALQKGGNGAFARIFGTSTGSGSDIGTTTFANTYGSMADNPQQLTAANAQQLQVFCAMLWFAPEHMDFSSSNTYAATGGFTNFGALFPKQTLAFNRCYMDATYYCEMNADSEFAVAGGGYTDENGNYAPSYDVPTAQASASDVKKTSGGGNRIACRMIKADCGRWSGIWEARLRSNTYSSADAKADGDRNIFAILGCAMCNLDISNSQ
jgi:hypothetical protein